MIGVLGGLLLEPASALIVGADQDDHSVMHLERAPMLESVGQVGTRRSGSAVYLGKGWIITANHAFVGRSSDVIIFSGKEYKIRKNSAVRLKNSSNGGGASRMADLVMVQLKTRPDLPMLELSASPPFSGEQVVMIGCGKTSSQVSLVDQRKNQGAVIQPISGAGDADAGPRWGENIVTDRGLDIGTDGDVGHTRAFATMRQPGSRPKNAQGASGDSGGGVFMRRGDGWELTGIMLSVFHRADLDASATFMADLSVYREQIESTIPEPSVAMMLLAAALASAGRRRR